MSRRKSESDRISPNPRSYCAAVVLGLLAACGSKASEGAPAGTEDSHGAHGHASHPDGEHAGHDHGAGPVRARSFVPPEPMDQLARQAAERRLAAPESLTLAGALGLNQLGIRFEETDWIAAAEAAFERRLAAPEPLSTDEAGEFLLRYRTIDLDPRWLARVKRDQADLAADALKAERLDLAAAEAALEALQAAVEAGDDNALLAAWASAQARFGHVWIDGSHAAIAFDGMRLERGDGGWLVVDQLDQRRDFTLRRAHGHDSMRHMPPGESLLLPDRIGGGAAPHHH